MSGRQEGSDAGGWEAEIEARNELRREAGLALLSVTTELKRSKGRR
jgi:hypothetical protein